MKKLKSCSSILALTLLFSPLLRAELISAGDPLGVLIQAEDRDTFIGRTHIINGVVFVPQDGYVFLDAFGGITSLTNKEIHLGTAYGSVGALDVRGETEAGKATVNAESIILSGDENRGFAVNGTDVGIGLLNVADGAEVNTNELFAASFRNYNIEEYSNTPDSFEAEINLHGEGTALNAGEVFLGNNSGSSARLIITGGAELNSSAVFGDEEFSLDFGKVVLAGNSTVSIDGGGSSLTTSNLLGSNTSTFDNFYDTNDYFSTINISNGGNLILEDALVGDLSNSELTNSQTNTTAYIGMGASTALAIDGLNSKLIVKASANDDLYIGTHDVAVNDNNTEARFRAGNGILELSNGGEVDVAGDVYIGGFDNDQNDCCLDFFNISPDRFDVAEQSFGQLTLDSGGSLTATNLYLREGAVLSGNQGSIRADVEVDGGVVSPGNSPGSILIDGDFTFNYGLLELEFLGLQADQQDVLDITGNAFLGDDATIDILFGFVPDFEVSLESFIKSAGLSFGSSFNFTDNINIRFEDSANVIDGDSFFFSFNGQRNLFTVGGVVAVHSPSTFLLFTIFTLFVLCKRKKLIGS